MPFLTSCGLYLPCVPHLSVAFYVVKSKASPEQFRQCFAVFSASRFFLSVSNAKTAPKPPHAVGRYKPAKVIPPAAFGKRYDFSIRVYEVRSSCAEVGVLHDIVSAQILCCIAQHDLAGFEYIAAIRYLERLIGVLLDDKYSNTVLV